MNRDDYLFNEKRCEQAISDFKLSASTRRWLNQYSELYTAITIKPEGYPRIASFNLGDETFEKIKLFSSLYSAVFDAFGEKEKKKIESDTIVFKIDTVALFEDRRFTNTTQETYLFIEKGYLMSNSDVKKYIPKFKPNSVHESEKNNFVHVSELKFLTSISEYNNTLIRVLELSTEYEQVNILFPYLVDNNDFDEISITKIISFSLKSVLVRRSFNAQRMMFELAFKNKRKMDSSLLHSILSDFPHSHGLFRITKGNK